MSLPHPATNADTPGKIKAENHLKDPPVQPAQDIVFTNGLTH
jgi:hypothetical protein